MKPNSHPTISATLLFFITPVLLWLVLLILLPHIDLLIMSFRLEDDYGTFRPDCC